MNDRTAYNRLFLSMSVTDAKDVLGFPPSYNPSPQEINKAWRALSLKHHPDRGGNPGKMVEVNVAKDILEGKRVNDKTDRYQENDPEVKRREEAEKKAKKDALTIRGEDQSARKVVEIGLSEVKNILLSTWRADVKEFLTEDFADAVDRIHDQAEAGVKTAEKDKGDWQKAVTLSQELSSSALRLSSKYSSIRKKLLAVQAETTIEGMEDLYAEAAVFVQMFKKLRESSGKMMSLIMSSEAIPMTWDDIYTKSHQRLIAYDQDFGSFSEKSMDAVKRQIEKSVNTVVDILKDYDADKKFPGWKSWKVPGDFEDALAIVGKGRPDKNASNVVLALKVASKFGA